MPFCASCGTPNPDGARFCAKCGSPMGAAPQAAQPPQPAAAPKPAAVPAKQALAPARVPVPAASTDGPDPNAPNATQFFVAAAGVSTASKIRRVLLFVLGALIIGTGLFCLVYFTLVKGGHEVVAPDAGLEPGLEAPADPAEPAAASPESSPVAPAAPAKADAPATPAPAAPGKTK
jgi:hypothetical protein